jgi:hypothetical protein
VCTGVRLLPYCARKLVACHMPSRLMSWPLPFLLPAAAAAAWLSPAFVGLPACQVQCPAQQHRLPTTVTVTRCPSALFAAACTEYACSAADLQVPVRTCHWPLVTMCDCATKQADTLSFIASVVCLTRCSNLPWPVHDSISWQLASLWELQHTAATVGAHAVDKKGAAVVL